MTRYEAVRSAAAGVAAVFLPSAARLDARSMAPMLDTIARDLATPHRPTAGRCLCAGCLSTRNYATAAVLASAAPSKGDHASAYRTAAAWHQQLGDAYYVANRVALAVGWQRPAGEVRSRAERRALRDQWAGRATASAPLPTLGGRRVSPGRQP